MNLDPTLAGSLALVFLTAGTVKGSVGIGLPTMAMGLMTLFIDPRSAIAILLLPMLLSNLWQVYRAGEVVRAARTYTPFAVCLALFVGITVFVTRDVNDNILLGVLGLIIVGFVVVSLTKWAPQIGDRYDRRAQIGFGTIAGVMGGLTAIWAPPMAIYLAARQVSKDEFVRATGLLITFGSLPLLAGYVAQGVLTLPLFIVSAGVLVPTFAGFAVGEKLRHRLSESGFRKLLLGVFLLMGLNLLRRAVFG